MIKGPDAPSRPAEAKSGSADKLGGGIRRETEKFFAKVDFSSLFTLIMGEGLAGGAIVVGWKRHISLMFFAAASSSSFVSLESRERVLAHKHG